MATNSTFSLTRMRSIFLTPCIGYGSLRSHRSGYAMEYRNEFKSKSVDMLGLYRRFLVSMRASHKDESRQLLCLRSGRRSGSGLVVDKGISKFTHL